MIIWRWTHIITGEIRSFQVWLNFFHVFSYFFRFQSPLKTNRKKHPGINFFGSFSSCSIACSSEGGLFRIHFFASDTFEINMSILVVNFGNVKIGTLCMDPSIAFIAFDPSLAVISGFKVHLPTIHTIIFIFKLCWANLTEILLFFKPTLVKSLRAVLIAAFFFVFELFELFVALDTVCHLIL